MIFEQPSFSFVYFIIQVNSRFQKIIVNILYGMGVKLK